MPDVLNFAALTSPMMKKALAIVARDFLGKVVGLHGVATAVHGGEAAVALLGITPRPPEDAVIPGRITVIDDGMSQAFTLVWIQAAPVRETCVVGTGNEMVVR